MSARSRPSQTWTTDRSIWNRARLSLCSRGRSQRCTATCRLVSDAGISPWTPRPAMRRDPCAFLWSRCAASHRALPAACSHGAPSQRSVSCPSPLPPDVLEHTLWSVFLGLLRPSKGSPTVLNNAQYCVLKFRVTVSDLIGPCIVYYTQVAVGLPRSCSRRGQSASSQWLVRRN